jgi:hypothetical protein
VGFGTRSRLAHPIFTRVVLAENFADLAAKLLVGCRRRLGAALWRFSSMIFWRLFTHRLFVHSNDDLDRTADGKAKTAVRTSLVHGDLGESV